MDQEEVAFLFRQRDLMSAPVVDRGVLVGAITVDDIVDEQQRANLFLKRERAMKRIEEMRKYGGGFDQKLIAAFEHADNNNKRKLAKGFPEIFEHLVD